MKAEYAKHGTDGCRYCMTTKIDVFGEPGTRVAVAEMRLELTEGHPLFHLIHKDAHQNPAAVATVLQLVATGGIQ